MHKLVASIAMAVGVSVSASAVTLLEGISAPDGFVGTKRSAGAWGPTGYVSYDFVNSIAEAEALFAAVDAGTDGEHPTQMFDPVQRDVVAAYIGGENGAFNFPANCGALTWEPAGGRWNGNERSYFTHSGAISVPTAGEWTIGVCVDADCDFSVAITNAAGEAVCSLVRADFSGSTRAFTTVNFAAGTYGVMIKQFRPAGSGGKGCIEFAAAKGVDVPFSTDDFRIIGDALAIYDVTFDTDGGSTVAAQQILGSRYATRPAENPTKAGVAFVKWILDGDSDGNPFDFSATPITADTVIKAVWEENLPPAIVSVAAASSAPAYSHWNAVTTLSVTATDPEADELTYVWSAEGGQPGGYTFGSPDASETTVTLKSAGTYTFKVTVSDGLNSISDTVSVTVTIPEGEAHAEFVGYEKTTNSPDWSEIPEAEAKNYAWGDADSGTKMSFRSTGTARKPYLLSAKHENAYGLDGYLFIGGNRERQDGAWTDAGVLVTGTYDEENHVVRDVTDYIASYEIGGTEILPADPNCFNSFLDDPRELTEWAPHIYAGGLRVNCDYPALGRVGTLVFGQKVLRHPRIRVGLVCANGNHNKPRVVRVGGAAHEWVTKAYDTYNKPDWMFFDLVGVQPGDRVDIEASGTTPYGNYCVISGITIDSMSLGAGLMVVVR